MGGQIIRKFSAKMTPQGKQNIIFLFFFSCTSTHQGATFLFLSKLHIFSRSEKSWGDKEKHYIEQQQTNKQTTNDDEHDPLKK